ncbi:hypothetical protein GCM10011531_24200 [Aquaticitalea lipolytica]|uniref:Uncharacterized protein n=1 Tax=Aquaticitalea lipolytica TaxID=1247562 RepID=A0A8J2TS39_9FLAO|nr:hypothetical protein GCM10011531_24200 [Aquaticitalea lipolytica]
MATSFSVPTINGNSYFFPSISKVAVFDILYCKFLFKMVEIINNAKLRNISRLIKHVYKGFNNSIIYKIDSKKESDY